MHKTDLAISAQRAGKEAQARSLFAEALKYERQAASLLAQRPDAEPTRSILHRSAATLALDCGEYRQAEVIICEGLQGHPPDEIAEELRDLLEQVYFRRHLALRGVALGETEIQMSIAGKAIGFGIAPLDVFLPRVNDAKTLVYRTAERLSEIPFRRSGPTTANILANVELFATVPRAASFAVSFRVGQTTQMSLPGNRSLGERTIDDVLECLDMFARGQEARLRKMIPQEEYYTNFVALATNLAPDGEAVNLVGFSALRNGELRTVSLTSQAMEAAVVVSFPVAALNEASSEEPPSEIQGILKEADSRDSKRGRIHIVDKDGTSHSVVVPPSMMIDIVKPLWESEVLITGSMKGKTFHLTGIRPLKSKLVGPTKGKPFDRAGIPEAKSKSKER